MRGQSAFEYLIIISIVITFIIPVWAYVLGIQQQTKDVLAISYAENTVHKIADISSLVYSQGPPAKVTIRIYIPSGVERFVVINNTIDIKLRTSAGMSDIYEISTANINLTQGLNDTLSEEGIYLLKIEAKNNVVQISQAP